MARGSLAQTPPELRKPGNIQQHATSGHFLQSKCKSILKQLISQAIRQLNNHGLLPGRKALLIQKAHSLIIFNHAKMS